MKGSILSLEHYSGFSKKLKFFFTFFAISLSTGIYCIEKF